MHKRHRDQEYRQFHTLPFQGIFLGIFFLIFSKARAKEVQHNQHKELSIWVTKLRPYKN